MESFKSNFGIWLSISVVSNPVYRESLTGQCICSVYPVLKRHYRTRLKSEQADIEWQYVLLAI